MAERPVDVAYVVSQWGAPTQTFVRREVAAVVAAGGRVRVLSLKPPWPVPMDVGVVYLNPWRVVLGAFATIKRFPRPAFRALRTVVTRSTPRNIAPQLWSCLVGFAWASGDKTNAEMVQAHFGWVAATAAWAESRITRRPYAVVLHAFELHTRRYLDRFTGVPLREATQVFTISSRDAEVVRSRWEVHAEVLRMGVSDEWLTTGMPDDRDPWRIVTVGSLVAKKGHEHLIEALTRCDPRWKLEIVGEGPEGPRLESLIRDLGLTDRVELVGACPEFEVREIVRRASVFALASVVAPDGDRDGIPVALMEAMACGTPVVTTRVGAIDELVEGCGLLVDAGDSAELGRAIDSLKDADLRREIGERGRARVESGFRAAAGGERVLAMARAAQ